MKLANTPRAVSTSGLLVILREELFVQTILAVTGVLFERFTSQTSLLNNAGFFFFFCSYNYYLPCIFCYGLNDVKLRMPEASLANNKDVMAITFFFFLFLDGLNNTLTNLLYFLGVECTLTSTRKQNCTSSSHTSAMCWMPYAA
jgi:hypothetical protein